MIFYAVLSHFYEIFNGFVQRSPSIITKKYLQMTNMEEKENFKSGTPPKKILSIPGTPSHFSLKTEKLGALKIKTGYLSVGVLTKISPNLEFSDNELVKSLLLAAATGTTIDIEQPDTPLTIVEGNKLTEKDIQLFAKTFLENDKQEISTDGHKNPLDAKAELANIIRKQIAEMRDSTKKIIDKFGVDISEYTKGLFIKNADTTKQLQAMVADNLSISGPSISIPTIDHANMLSMANRIEPLLAINFEPLSQRKITYSVLISVDSFLLPA
jgi:hypothetical protein